MERDFLLSIFFGFCAGLFLSFFPGLALPYQLAAGAAFLAPTALLVKPRGAAMAFIALILCIALNSALPQFKSMELQICIFFLGMSLMQKKELDGMFLARLSGPKEILITALHSVGLFIAMAAIVMLFGMMLILLGMPPDNSGVFQKIAGLPFYMIGVAVFLAPLGEEVLFRGFAAKRFGVLASSAIFALAHFAYGSYYEMAGTFLIGILLAVYLRRANNLAACIGAHMIYNFVTVFLLLFMGGQAGMA